MNFRKIWQENKKEPSVLWSHSHELAMTMHLLCWLVTSSLWVVFVQHMATSRIYVMIFFFVKTFGKIVSKFLTICFHVYNHVQVFNQHTFDEQSCKKTWRMKLYVQIRWQHSNSKQTFHYQLGISSVSAIAQYGNHQNGSNIELIAFIA